MKKIVLFLFLFFLCTGIANATLIGSYAHTWNGTENSMANRLWRDGDPSGDPPKVFPGVYVEQNYYLTYDLFNNLDTSTWITVSAALVPDSSVYSFFSLYTAFDPNDLSSGYLGDAGQSGSPQLFAVEIPALSSFILVASTVSGDNALGTSYSVQISDNPVPEPSTMLLLGVGVAGLTAVTRRKLKK